MSDSRVACNVSPNSHAARCRGAVSVSGDWMGARLMELSAMTPISSRRASTTERHDGGGV
eukprot:7299723-Prymnesium_polylepis.1